MQILTNEGNGYNPSTGYFTVPVAGTYLFIFTIYAKSSSNNMVYATLHLVDSTRKMQSTIARGLKNYIEVGNSALCRLNKGDRVYIQCHTGSSGILAGSPYKETAFTGILMYK